MNRQRLQPVDAARSSGGCEPVWMECGDAPAEGESTSLRRIEGAPLDAWCYRPAVLSSPALTLISVHGISRNSREHLVAWKPYADQHGFQLVAPDFPARSFRGYQQLDYGRGGETPDALIAELVERLPELAGFERGPACLSGFSGGAQFAHRFLLTQPGAVQAAVLTAPGWWTLPTAGLPFPHGCGPGQKRACPPLDPEHWLRQPLLVAVGANDTARDPNLRQDPFTDSRQGVHRLARAEAWVREVRSLAVSGKQAAGVRLEVLPGAGHDFMECMGAGLGESTITFLKDCGLLDPVS